MAKPKNETKLDVVCTNGHFSYDLDVEDINTKTITATNMYGWKYFINKANGEVYLQKDNKPKELVGIMKDSYMNFNK